MAYFRYCPGCRNDVSEVVRAGEKLKDSKKKSKMASASSSSQRDWGKVSFLDTFMDKTWLLWHVISKNQKYWLVFFLYFQGMACAGRTKQCTIVPSNHYGPVPCVPVGSQWKFRVQVSQLDPRSEWQPSELKEEVIILKAVKLESGFLSYHHLIVFFTSLCCHLVVIKVICNFEQYLKRGFFFWGAGIMLCFNLPSKA